MNLTEHEHIITAFADSASGPGWANHPIWVIVRDKNTGVIRQECIQPDEQTDEMEILYKVSQVAHRAMTNAVESQSKLGRPK